MNFNNSRRNPFPDVYPGLDSVATIIRQQPGPEVAEQLSVYQASLKEKTRQMKAMASELNMYQAQVGGEDRETASVMAPRPFLDVN